MEALCLNNNNIKITASKLISSLITASYFTVYIVSRLYKIQYFDYNDDIKQQFDLPMIQFINLIDHYKRKYQCNKLAKFWVDLERHVHTKGVNVYMTQHYIEEATINSSFLFAKR